MKVFCAWRNYEENDLLLGVFDTKEKAEDCISEVQKPHIHIHSDDWSVTEEEVR